MGFLLFKMEREGRSPNYENVCNKILVSLLCLLCCNAIIFLVDIFGGGLVELFINGFQVDVKTVAEANALLLAMLLQTADINAKFAGKQYRPVVRFEEVIE